MGDEKDQGKGTQEKGTKTPKMTKEAKTLEILRRPFESARIKERKGRGRTKFSYIEAHSVIERLNEAFGLNWSFEVVSHEQLGGEFVVLGKLSANGVVKMQFGGKPIETYSKGDREGEVISESDNIKAATSDALKKCATLFGIALDLYSGTTNTGTGSTGGRSGKQNGKGNGNGSSIGDLKNRIIAGEKKVTEITEVSAADMRDEKLGSQGLDQPKNKLEDYLAFLLAEYAEVSEGK